MQKSLINHTRNSGPLDTVALWNSGPHTSLRISLADSLLSQLLNSCYFYPQWVTRKMLSHLFFPKHFLDHFLFPWFICHLPPPPLDDKGSRVSFSKGDSFTLTLLRPLHLDEVQTFLGSLLMSPDHFPSIFPEKHLALNFMPLDSTDHCLLLFHLWLPPLSFAKLLENLSPASLLLSWFLVIS